MSAAKTIAVALGDIAVSPDRMRRLRHHIVDDLAESMAQRGLIEPIVIQPRQVADGYWLIAGWHRLAAAMRLGWPSTAAVVLDGVGVDQALLIEIDENLIRAELTPAERALHLRERKRLYEALHPETKKGAAGKHRQKSRIATSEPAPAFIDDTAHKTKKHRATIAREVARGGKITGIADAIGTTLDSADELDALAKLSEPVQRDLIERAKAGEKVTAKHVAKKLRREARERDLAEATEAASRILGEKLYGVLYVDDAWRFELWAESGRDRVADNHYPTMPLDEIKALKVPAADNCVMFSWATVPMLPQALEVVQARGFTYKSAVFWIKDRDGTGYWERERVEILIISTKGDKVPAPVPGEQIPQVICAPRAKRHSEKPDIFAEHIERLYPNVPKLEMFARKGRAKWDSWGNEIDPTEKPQPPASLGAISASC
jgi:ParB/RepB/Spo0J family partition protein